MGLRVDVRVHPQADRSDLARFAGHLVEARKFACGFDVEAKNAGGERRAHFRRGLADTGKHDLLRLAAGLEHARKFAAGDDVEAAAEPGEHVEHGQIRIGFDRVANKVIAARQRLIVGAVGGLQRGARVYVAGRAARLGDAIERHSFNAEPLIAVCEKCHGESVSGFFFSSSGAPGMATVGAAAGLSFGK